MKTEIVKTFVLLGLFVLTCFVGILPIKIVKIVKNRSGTNLHSQKKYRRTVSLLSCFAAGVFLATCILGLLPDVRKDLTSVFISLDIRTKFPVAEFVMSFGLFIILVIEQVVLFYKEKHLSEDEASKPLLSKDGETSTGRERQRDLTRSLSRSLSMENSISGISDQPIMDDKQPRNMSGYHSDDGSNYHHDYHDRVFHSDHDLEHSHEHELLENSEHSHSIMRSLLLLVALSVHSLFEGLAVGLQRNNDKVLSIFAALVLHKCILSFSLGMNVVQSKLSYWAMIRSIFIFSISSPVGIAIGIGIIDLWDSKVSTLVQGLLQGIACGTFLYVTFFEVLPHEFNSKDMRLIKVVFLLLGFSTITAVIFLQNNYGG